MAKCEEGYLCDVCGGDVAEITDSDLYLRYVIGMLDPEMLHTTPRAAHPLQSGAGAVHRRRRLRAGRRRRARSTSGSSTPLRPRAASGWSPAAGGGSRKSPRWSVPIIDYPLPEVIEQISRRSSGDVKPEE